MYADADSITTTIDFVLPNRGGKPFLREILVLQSDDGHSDHARRCRIDVVAAWNLFRWLPYRRGDRQISSSPEVPLSETDQ